MTIPGRSRRLAALAIAALAATSLVACSPEEEDSTPETTGTGGETTATADAPDLAANYQAILDAGTVADDATIEANAWAAAVKESGTLTVGGTETSELFSLHDPATGTTRGFDAGLSQLLSKYILGEVSTDLVQVSVDTREDLLVNNTVDVVFATYSITPERAERIGFAGPYYTSQTGILVAADNTDITSVEDLAGKIVATQAASTGVTILEEFAPDAEILELPDNVQALAAVQQGRADAYVIDQGLLLNAVVANDDVKIVGEQFGPGDNYGIGVNKDSDAKEFINDWLRQIEEDGTWAELWQVTIGDRTGLTEAPAFPEIGSVEGS
ncbi:MAG: glutamate ABC transporter substrate-binding protein [Cellulomonadaceae bacterium]